jgi:hypothetical protein
MCLVAEICEEAGCVVARSPLGSLLPPLLACDCSKLRSHSQTNGCSLDLLDPCSSQRKGRNLPRYIYHNGSASRAECLTFRIDRM